MAPTAELRGVLAEMRREIDILRRRESIRESQLRQLRNEFDHAARIQREIVGQIPAVHNAEITVFTHPADRVSGDFHFVRRVNPQTVVLGVADATGHGLAAGLIAAAVKGMMDHAVRTPCSASDVLDHLNRQLLAYAFSECEFITAVHAEFEEPTRILRWARAGGPPPILLRSGEPPRRLASGGLPLGVVANARLVPMEIQLQPGDAVVLHSDGLEALHAVLSANSGEAAFLGWLTTQLDRGLDETVKANPRRTGPPGTPESDDMTALTLRVHA